MQKLNHVQMDILKEFGNILASAYLSALGNMLSKTLTPSVPLLAYDIAGTVVDYVMIELSKSNDQAMLVETGFT